MGTPSIVLAAALPRTGRRWTRTLAAALLLVGGFAPWMAGSEGPRAQDQASNGFLAGISTAAVVYSENSGSRNG
ncbi:MAG: hypothetical protein JKY65_29045 [Planctomycetes bacterium]|nr:hypothetical protein [Planctomycetota bacterium]